MNNYGNFSLDFKDDELKAYINDSIKEWKENGDSDIYYWTDWN